MIQLMRAVESNASDVVANMRAQEIEEYKLVDSSPIDAITQSIKSSAHSWVAFVDGKIACMWGIKEESLLGGAHIWLVTTPLIEKYPRKFLRESRKVVNGCIMNYGFLYGYVDDRFEISKRWLEWLGFEVANRVQLGDLNLIRYEMRAQDGH